MCRTYNDPSFNPVDSLCMRNLRQTAPSAKLIPSLHAGEVITRTTRKITRRAFFRTHTSAKAADLAKLLGGGYNCDSTSIPRAFDACSTAYQRSLSSQ